MQYEITRVRQFPAQKVEVAFDVFTEVEIDPGTPEARMEVSIQLATQIVVPNDMPQAAIEAQVAKVVKAFKRKQAAEIAIEEGRVLPHLQGLRGKRGEV